MTTFNVDNVKIGSFPKFYCDSKRNLKNIVGFGVEGSSNNDNLITFGTNNLLAAINTSYDNHLPLTLSPDMIWLTIAQGLSYHINNNAEELRHQFVNHEGKKTIEVYENGFIKGNPNNNWQHMFGQFSNQIENYIGKKRDLIVGDFSTTGPVEKAAHEIVLMEAMKKYFNYECHTCCGIPEITLLGSKEDWVNIENRVKTISEFGLSWWVSELQPIIHEFVAASYGRINKEFWQNIFKQIDPGSGGPYITGWITKLFPYLKNYADKNNFSAKNSFKLSKYGHDYTTSQFPIGMAKVPFKWMYYSETFNMELAAGFTGFKQENGSIVPQIGFSVRDTETYIEIKASYKEEKGWEEQNKIKNEYLSKLKSFDFEHINSCANKLNGFIPKIKLENVKNIPGLTVIVRDENQSSKDDEENLF